MKPTILVDMDGPLADFDAHFWQLCADRGWTMNCEPHEQSRRYATDHVVDLAQRQAARQYINDDPHWFADLPVTVGAVEGINELADHADVWICTKPLEANEQCRDGKAQWVRQHLGSDWEKRLIIAPDKSMVRGHVLLDDAIRLYWIEVAEWLPVVFPTSWNGPGSPWAGLPRWQWGDPVQSLITEAMLWEMPA